MKISLVSANWHQTITTLISIISIISIVQSYQIVFANNHGQRVTGQVAILDTNLKYKIVNQHSGLVLGIANNAQAAGTTVIQSTDNGTTDHLWHFIPDSNSYYKIENVNSGEVLGISNASKDEGATALQWSDNGTDDHLWQLSLQSNGSYTITNKNSGLALMVSEGSKSPGATVLQSITNDLSNTWKLVAARLASVTGSASVNGNTAELASVNPNILSGDITVHDPSMTKTASGTYYIFSTGPNIPMHSSTDRMHFSNAGTAFAAPPSWINTYNGGKGSDIWAPDISYHHNQYWLYYAVSTFGSQNSAIGLATSTAAKPRSWIDQGIVLTSSSSAPYNAIDPCLVVDASGNWWLSFGSYWNGIYIIQIDPSTGKQLSSNTMYYHLAKRLVTSKGLEASYIYQHGRYYYLFASIDTCCRANATYHIIVGRSTSITGPYTDKGGVNMLIGGGTIILSTHGNIVGPGGASIMSDTDGTLIDYHYYNANTGGTPSLGINLMGWDAAGWPYVY
jgi:arabinan endo-1,5-alpha-L-arabinosidase